MILGPEGGKRPEYGAQVPSVPAPGLVLSSPTYSTAPLGSPPKASSPIPSYFTSIPAVTQEVPEPTLPTPSLVPRGAAPTTETEKPRNPKKPARTGPKDDGQLEDYSYTRSAAELARVRKERPSASAEVSVENTATPLSWEAYDKLSLDQRAAVDMNGLLVQAREVDLKQDPKFFDADELKQYQIDVESIFGKGGGSDTIGFQTVALLKRIDFKAIGQDLDEFLSLERAVSAKDLKDFTFSDKDLKALNAYTPEQSVAPTQYANVRTDANMEALDTALIQSALSAYKTNLAEKKPRGWDIQASLGIPMSAPMMTPNGYFQTLNEDSDQFKLDRNLDDAYIYLQAHPDETGLAAIFQDFKDRNWEPEIQQKLWDYVNDRTLRETQTLGDETAQRIRTALGWK
jgi:hypothetical protein